MSFPCSAVRNLALAALLACTPATLTSGHAYIDTSSPADASTVPPPREAILKFTENVELEFSTIAVKSPAGEVMSVGRVRQPAPNTLSVDLKLLPPGPYTIEWRVLSVDTHITDGILRFTVAPAGRRGP
ncbi:MAG: copper resistance protein CopC [Candidatus Rokuibacteriota bacterium]|nr:MAG: copper resistance protein CopC [Candidatus Rokubacteria bacterium]